MRRSTSVVWMAIGAIVFLLGLVGAFVTFGPAVFADCGPDCVARGERRVAIGLGFAALCVAIAGAWLVRFAVRAWTARVAELTAAKLAGGRAP